MTSLNIIQPCSDVTDIIPLFPQLGLYLKPIAKLNISVHLPTLKLPGKTISNWEVMEKLKYWTIPDEFTTIKVSKNTLEFIRFEAEIESRSKLSAVLARLDGRFIKLSGFTESLKVRAAEAKCDFPTRHAWDSYFRDAKNMNEMKAGERPDTIHITNLPCKWFASKSNPDKPSEYILRKVFETFGEVRCVDIPSIDPYRNRMKAHISGIKMFSYHQNVVFEGYIQFKEYVSFMKAMDGLRGMKLIYKEDMKIFSASIKVDFDKTKHLSDSSVKKRRHEREKMMAEEREQEEQERLKKEKEEAEKEAERMRKLKEKEEKLARRKNREEKRKLKQLEKFKVKEAEDMNRKIASEERLLLMAQRRLESIRLLSELFKRVEEATLKKLIEKKKLQKYLKKDKGKSKGKEVNKSSIGFNELKLFANKEEDELRKKLIEKLKSGDTNKKNTTEEDSLPGSSKMQEVVSSSVSGAVPVSSSSENDAASLITSSESGMSDLNDDGKNKDKEGKQPVLDNYHAMNRSEGMSSWRYPHNHNSSVCYNPYLMMSNSPGFGRHPHRPYFPRGRRGYRFPRYSMGRGRGGYIPQPYFDPLLLDINHQYYKYFHKLARNKISRSRSRSSKSRSYSYSRSQSRSSSRSRSYYSRRYSRSRSRSDSSHSLRRSRRRHQSRSSERSYSTRRSKSSHSRRSKRSRSYSRQISRSRSSNDGSMRHSRDKSRNKTRSKEKNYDSKQVQSTNCEEPKIDKNNKRKTRWDADENQCKTDNVNKIEKSENKTESEHFNQSTKEVKNKDNSNDYNNDQTKRSPVRFPSVPHTWSRSPSHCRSLSWEKNDSKTDNTASKVNLANSKSKKEKRHKKYKKSKKKKKKHSEKDKRS